MQNGVLVGACAHCRVTEWNELGVVGLEGGPSLFGRALADDDHEAAHEEGGVGLFGKIDRRVVVDLVVSVLAVVHELLKLLAE